MLYRTLSAFYAGLALASLMVGVVAHAHFDHVVGLTGFVAMMPAALFFYAHHRKELRLYGKPGR